MQDKQVGLVLGHIFGHVKIHACIYVKIRPGKVLEQISEQSMFVGSQGLQFDHDFIRIYTVTVVQWNLIPEEVC